MNRNRFTTRSTRAQRRRRAEIEAHIEALIQLLDDLDGDCDLEDGADLEYDGYDEREGDTADDEPSIGWTNDARFMGQTFDPDCEWDPAEQGVADRDALADAHEELVLYQHLQKTRGDTEARP